MSYHRVIPRGPWPLYIETLDCEETVPVFNDDGSLSDEMLALIEGESN